MEEREKQLFLRWALLMSLTAVIIAMLAFLGHFRLLYALDASRISFVILVVFAYGLVRCGALTWRVSEAEDLSAGKAVDVGRILRDADLEANNGWHAAETCELLGMFGTIWGLVMALMQMYERYFGETAASAAGSADMRHMVVSMATAFLTTLVGLACKMVLRDRYHALNQKILQLQAVREDKA
jgi:hypothetical protein